MTTPIDYSRPVGWWCPVCGMEWREYPQTRISRHAHAVIPRYLEIPEGQRPPAASEVEDAEVVTYSALGIQEAVFRSPSGWIAFEATTETINRIVTGATR